MRPFFVVVTAVRILPRDAANGKVNAAICL